MTELLSIGRFARLSGLTLRAIRHYGELGLLNAALVDPSTGYRYYSPEQLTDAEAIKRLRSLDLPLDEIQDLLGRADPDDGRRILSRHRVRLERRVEATLRILAELQRVIDGKETLVPGRDKETIRFELRIEEVEPRHGLGVRVRARVDEMGTVIPQAIEEVHAFLEGRGLGFAGAPFCICPFTDDEEGEVTVGWPTAGPHRGSGRIEPVELPSGRALVLRHVGPYDALGRSYRLMTEVMAEGGLEAAGGGPVASAGGSRQLTEAVLPRRGAEVREHQGLARLYFHAGARESGRPRLARLHVHSGAHRVRATTPPRVRIEPRRGRRSRSCGRHGTWLSGRPGLMTSCGGPSVVVGSRGSEGAVVAAPAPALVHALHERAGGLGAAVALEARRLAGLAAVDDAEAVVAGVAHVWAGAGGVAQGGHDHDGRGQHHDEAHDADDRLAAR